MTPSIAKIAEDALTLRHGVIRIIEQLEETSHKDAIYQMLDARDALGFAIQKLNDAEVS
jgi:hypothetical protein